MLTGIISVLASSLPALTFCCIKPSRKRQQLPVFWGSEEDPVEHRLLSITNLTASEWHIKFWWDLWDTRLFSSSQTVLWPYKWIKGIKTLRWRASNQSAINRNCVNSGFLCYYGFENSADCFSYTEEPILESAFQDFNLTSSNFQAVLIHTCMCMNFWKDGWKHSKMLLFVTECCNCVVWIWLNILDCVYSSVW